MGASLAMTRRFKLRSGALLALLLVWFALPMSGCGGCGQSAAERKQAEADAARKKKEEEEKKKKEKSKPDFEISMLHVEPADPEETIAAAKPGHWLSGSRKAIANNFDFVGSLDAGVSVMIDNRAVPLALAQQPFLLQTTRNVVLPKGREKYLDETLFIPRGNHNPWVNDRLDNRGGSTVIEPPSEPLQRMPDYQYYFLILARDRSRYKLFARKDALLGPSWDGNLSYYRVNAPLVDKYVPLPVNSLAWTSTAFVLWDDVDPGLLSAEQKQAMLDWLHWGGQLIISGPDTLTLLQSSFLAAYLPAKAGKSRSLTAESLAPLSAAMQPTEHGKSILPLQPPRAWNGVTLELRPSAHWLPDGHSDLIAERTIGRGSIVVTAFRISQRDLLNWEGFDTLLNSCLLRHPARRFVESNDNLDRAWAPEWANAGLNRFDPSLTCNLRYLSRDMGADGRFVPGGRIPPPAATPGDDPFGSGAGPSDPMPISTTDDESVGSGFGGWNDFSAVSSAARDTLRSAAGITIPRADFIAWMLAAYLAVLGPLNWGFFRLLGRVEWAWIAAPLIAIVGAVVVTKAAHLNIGFARSQTEIDVVELQPDYPRAHLTRYAALYTSLSTSYDIRFDDPRALIQPFAGGGQSRLRQSERTVTLHRDADVRLSDFEVSSNSTAMLHSEQMIDCGGGIACEMLAGKPRIYNRCRFTIDQAGVVWRTASGALRSAWIGRLPPDSDRPLDFEDVRNEKPTLEQHRNAETPADDAAVRLNVAKLATIVENPVGYSPGEMRLMGVLAGPLPGMEVSPQSSQATRSGVFLVANLRYPALPRPEPDVNIRPGKNARLDPLDTSDTSP